MILLSCLAAVIILVITALICGGMFVDEYNMENGIEEETNKDWRALL